jgi:hypothetical protein
MDIKELEKNLRNFFEECKTKGYPLETYCLIEDNTEYILEVKANWIDQLDSCSKALDILNDILWDTTNVETRKRIFAISVLDSEEQPHCYTEVSHD